MRGGKEGTRWTTEMKRKAQLKAQIRENHPLRKPGWAGEALDLYLSGEAVKDICECYGIGNFNSFYVSISKEALLRLMEAKHADRLSEVEEMMK